MREPVFKSFLRVWLQTELDGIKFSYKLIKAMKKFEKWISHRKTTVNSAKARQQCAHKMGTIRLHKHEAYFVLILEI